jgi:hypothetical protein
MSIDGKIKELFTTHGIPLNRDMVWAVQGKPVIYHKALEMLAAALKIKFDEPRILRAERDECVMLVFGHLPTGQSEWSVGEAIVNVNYGVTGKQKAYVYAMAEKRGKDRVILKLAGLHGAYADEEADAFKNGGENGDSEDNENGVRQRIEDARKAALAYVSLARTAMQNAETKEEARKWWYDEAANREKNGVVEGTPEFKTLAAEFNEFKRGLPYADMRAAG